jgi:hypothetical protein
MLRKEYTGHFTRRRYLIERSRKDEDQDTMRERERVKGRESEGESCERKKRRRRKENSVDDILVILGAANGGQDLSISIGIWIV